MEAKENRKFILCLEIGNTVEGGCPSTSWEGMVSQEGKCPTNEFPSSSFSECDMEISLWSVWVPFVPPLKVLSN